VIKKNAGGDLGGEDYSGTLANDGVLLSDYHDLKDEIDAIAGLTAEIEALRAEIEAGTIKVCTYLARGC
jgi:hypothetical protein